mmetsp:Transcript_16596/g.27982  ORF Transcript_16596/g.27982 Transcript_16596/m.27982 type:complete len:203 (-) Transcript_16596:547-1155(-)
MLVLCRTRFYILPLLFRATGLSLSTLFILLFILHQQHCVHAPVVLRVIRHLRVLPPHDLPPRRDQTQLADVHLDNRPLREHAQLRVHVSVGILLHADNIEHERALELGVCGVNLGHAHSCGPDESLVLWRLPGEALAHECRLCDHPLPALLHPLTRPQHLEHFVLCHGAHFGKGDLPLARLLLALLLNGVAKDLRSRVLLPV